MDDQRAEEIADTARRIFAADGLPLLAGIYQLLEERKQLLEERKRLLGIARMNISMDRNDDVFVDVTDQPNVQSEYRRFPIFVPEETFLELERLAKATKLDVPTIASHTIEFGRRSREVESWKNATR